MKISPYLKALLYVFLFLFIYMFILASISIFITRSEEPALFGAFTTLFMLSMALIIIGLLQVKQAQKNGQSKSWYQQYEVSLGLCLLCFLCSFLTLLCFDILPRTLFSSRSRIGLFFSFRFSRSFSFCYLSSTDQRMMKSREGTYNSSVCSIYLP